ncbi:MAG: hypothetical protein JKY95_03395 [Planctomycetaceae bacterium]|nr:hypothetical protein [Planctomycetaceae bacterium]
MKRLVQHQLLCLAIIAAMLFDIGGSVVAGCPLESSPEQACCCSQGVDADGSPKHCQCNCSTSVGACSCMESDQAPALPPVRQSNQERQNYQRTIVAYSYMVQEASCLRFDRFDDSSICYLLCSTRRRAILGCWIT